jgi:hypothetical protein
MRATMASSRRRVKDLCVKALSPTGLQGKSGLNRLRIGNTAAAALAKAKTSS